MLNLKVDKTIINITVFFLIRSQRKFIFDNTKYFFQTQNIIK